jgi:hypothetical protein
MSQKEWNIAYIFSSFSKSHLVNKNPYSQNKLQLDHPFYNWKALDFHVAVCSQIGRWEEATKTYEQLVRLTEEHQEYFHPEEIQRINNNRIIFETIPG